MQYVAQQFGKSLLWWEPTSRRLLCLAFLLCNQALVSLLLLRHSSFGLLINFDLNQAAGYVLQGLCWAVLVLTLTGSINFLLGFWALRFVGLFFLLQFTFQLRKAGNESWFLHSGLSTGLLGLATIALNTLVIGEDEIVLEMANKNALLSASMVWFQLAAFVCVYQVDGQWQYSGLSSAVLLLAPLLVTWYEFQFNELVSGLARLVYRVLLFNSSLGAFLVALGLAGQIVTGSGKAVLYALGMLGVLVYSYLDWADRWIGQSKDLPLPLLEIQLLRLSERDDEQSHSLLRTFVLEHESRCEDPGCCVRYVRAQSDEMLRWTKRLMRMLKVMYLNVKPEEVELHLCAAYFLSRVMSERKSSLVLVEPTHLSVRNAFKYQFLMRSVNSNDYRNQTQSHKLSDQVGRLKGELVAALDYIGLFWQELCEERVNLLRLEELANLVGGEVAKVMRSWAEFDYSSSKELVHICRATTKILVLAMNHTESKPLVDRLKQMEKAVEVRLRKQKTSYEGGGFFEVNDLGVIIASTTNEYLGIITQTNNTFVRDFGYSKKEISGRKINVLLFEGLAEVHDEIIERFVYSKDKELPLMGLERTVYALDKKKYLFKTTILLKFLAESCSEGVQMVAYLRRVRSRKQVCHCIVNSHGELIALSSSFVTVFKLDNRCLSRKPHISSLLPGVENYETLSYSRLTLQPNYLLLLNQTVKSEGIDCIVSCAALNVAGTLLGHVFSLEPRPPKLLARNLAFETAFASYYYKARCGPSGQLIIELSRRRAADTKHRTNTQRALVAKGSAAEDFGEEITVLRLIDGELCRLEQFQEEREFGQGFDSMRRGAYDLQKYLRESEEEESSSHVKRYSLETVAVTLGLAATAVVAYFLYLIYEEDTSLSATLKLHVQTLELFVQVHKLSLAVLCQALGLDPGFDLQAPLKAANEAVKDIGFIPFDFVNVAGLIAQQSTKLASVVSFSKHTYAATDLFSVEVGSVARSVACILVQYPVVVALAVCLLVLHTGMLERRKEYFSNFLYLPDSLVRLQIRKCAVLKKYLEDGDINPVQDLGLDARPSNSDQFDSKTKKFKEARFQTLELVFFALVCAAVVVFLGESVSSIVASREERQFISSFTQTVNQAFNLKAAFLNRMLIANYLDRSLSLESYQARLEAVLDSAKLLLTAQPAFNYTQMMGVCEVANCSAKNKNQEGIYGLFWNIDQHQNEIMARSSLPPRAIEPLVQSYSRLLYDQSLPFLQQRLSEQAQLFQTSLRAHFVGELVRRLIFGAVVLGLAGYVGHIYSTLKLRENENIIQMLKFVPEYNRP